MQTPTAPASGAEELERLKVVLLNRSQTGLQAGQGGGVSAVGPDRDESITAVVEQVRPKARCGGQRGPQLGDIPGRDVDRLGSEHGAEVGERPRFAQQMPKFDQDLYGVLRDLVNVDLGEARPIVVAGHVEDGTAGRPHARDDAGVLLLVADEHGPRRQLVEGQVIAVATVQQHPAGLRLPELAGTVRPGGHPVRHTAIVTDAAPLPMLAIQSRAPVDGVLSGRR